MAVVAAGTLTYLALAASAIGRADAQLADLGTMFLDMFRLSVEEAEQLESEREFTTTVETETVTESAPPERRRRR